MNPLERGAPGHGPGPLGSGAAGAGPCQGPGPDPDPGLEVTLDRGDTVQDAAQRLLLRKQSFSWSQTS